MWLEIKGELAETGRDWESNGGATKILLGLGSLYTFYTLLMLKKATHYIRKQEDDWCKKVLFCLMQYGISVQIADSA